MSSKTKIVVFHMKELIYTGIFIVLAIILILLFLFMFLPKDKSAETAAAENLYHPGVYSSSLTLNGNTVNLEVTVDENHINSIRLVNLDETVNAMFPLMEPALENITTQIYSGESMEDLTYSKENQYTSSVLIHAIQNALTKASAAETDSDTGTGSGNDAAPNAASAPSAETNAAVTSDAAALNPTGAAE